MTSLDPWYLRRKWWAGSGLVLVAILTSAYYIGIALPVKETRAVVEAYNSLELGLPGKSLSHHFPRGPDLICTFGQSQVLYYHADARAHFIPSFGDNQKQKIFELKQRGTAQLEDLPYLYGYIQILVDLDTKSVVAKTWHGETYHVHTIRGDFRGSTLGDLPVEVRDAFHLSGNETGLAE